MNPSDLKKQLAQILEGEGLAKSQAGQEPESGWRGARLISKHLASLGAAVAFTIMAAAPALAAGSSGTLQANSSMPAQIAGMETHILKSEDDFNRYKSSIKHDKPGLYNTMNNLSGAVKATIGLGGGAFAILDGAAKRPDQSSATGFDKDQQCTIYMNLESASPEALRAFLFQKLPLSITKIDSKVPFWKAEKAFDLAMAGESMASLNLSPEAQEEAKSVAKFAQTFTLAHEAGHCRLASDMTMDDVQFDKYHEGAPDLVGAVYAAKDAASRGVPEAKIAEWVGWMSDTRHEFNKGATADLDKAYLEAAKPVKGFANEITTKGLDEAVKGFSLENLKDSVDHYRADSPVKSLKKTFSGLFGMLGNSDKVGASPASEPVPETPVAAKSTEDNFKGQLIASLFDFGKALPEKNGSPKLGR